MNSILSKNINDVIKHLVEKRINGTSARVQCHFYPPTININRINSIYTKQEVTMLALEQSKGDIRSYIEEKTEQLLAENHLKWMKENNGKWIIPYYESRWELGNNPYERVEVYIAEIHYFEISID